MRRFLIDTDTASDDAVALIMALRAKNIKVEAITTVSGNLPIDLCLKNALTSVQIAGTYAPPVYKGIDRPILRKAYTSEYVHGDDGMGNMNLPEPSLKQANMHAVDAIIELVMKNPNEIEIVTLGPLTNLAIAYLKEPRIAQNVKHVYIMGGAGLGQGNITPVAEFNIYVDAEAASIILNSGMNPTFVGWDASMGKTFVNLDDINYLSSKKSAIADFCIRCNKVLQEFNYKRLGLLGFDLPDPATMAVALYPEIMTEKFDAYAYVETKSESTYGQLIIDKNNVLKKDSNATICTELDAAKFKEILFELIV